MEMEQSMAVSVKKVCLVLNKTKILTDIDLEIGRGKIYGLVGRNGSGKTMLMKCICGFVKPTEGEIRVRGQVVGKDVDFPPDLGILIENPGFIPYYGGMENLKMLAGLNRKIDRDRIEESMRLVGLDPALKLHVGKYSLGMRQRLGLAQAVMENPDILILDEPMNGLDNQGVEDMRKMFLKERERGRTILMASHNPADIDILCDEVYGMDRGECTRVK